MVFTFWDIPGIQSQASLEILEQLLSPVCVFDQQGQTLYASPTFLALLPAHTKTSQVWDCFSNAAAPTPLATLWQSALQGDQPQFLVNTRDGWGGLECSLQFNSDAKLMFLTAKERRIEAPKAYQALVRTEAKWQAVAANCGSWLLQTSSTGQIQRVSPVVEQGLEYAEAELLGRHLIELIHPDQFTQLEIALATWQAGDRTPSPPIESWWRTQSGNWIALSLQGQKFPPELEMDGLMISGHDITDRKVLEQALQASRQQFNAILLNLPGAIFRCDASYTMSFMSDGIEDIAGYPAATFTQNQVQSFLSIIHPDDVSLINSSLINTVVTRNCVAIDYRLIHADGRVRWVSERKQGVFDRTGQLVGLHGILLDVSDRKQTEANLRRCQAVNQSMVQMSPDLMRPNCLECVPDLRLPHQTRPQMRSVD